MGNLWKGSALVAAVMALALSAAVTVAQSAVTVFTGTVTLDSTAAPAGTTVNVTLQSGSVIGTGTTGGTSFAANQYRIDIQAARALEGQTVNLIVPGTPQATEATAVFNAYTVRTVNIVATTTAGATAPGAPTNVVATAGNAPATVSFSAPDSNGGSTITSFTVTLSGGLTETGTASRITVTGLTNFTTYTFTVTATNAAGTGPASALVSETIASRLLQSPPGPGG